MKMRESVCFRESAEKGKREREGEEEREIDSSRKLSFENAKTSKILKRVKVRSLEIVSLMKSI